MRKRFIATVFVVVLIVIGLLYLLSPLPAPSLTKYLQVYIRSDGTIEPSSTPINREGNLYTLQANIILEKLSIEKNNITVDGNGFSLRIYGGTTKMGPLIGDFEISNVENVTLRNLYLSITKLIFENSSFCEVVNSSYDAIEINNSHNILVSENDQYTTYSKGGISSVQITNSTNFTISSCKFYGVHLKNADYNMILNNEMTEMKDLAFSMVDSNSNLFFGNRIERSIQLLEITGSSGNNLFVGNYIQGAFSIDPVLNCGEVNTFYHNNFVYVYWNKTVTNDTPNLWDNGSEGNYWNDNQGEDSNSDGIGDTPHFVDDNNKDRYPLMNPLDLSLEPLPQLPK